MTLIAGKSALTNEAIAFLRAYDFSTHLHAIPMLSRSDIKIGIFTSRNVGDTNRCSGVCIVLRSILAKEYEQLSAISKMLTPWINQNLLSE